MGDQHSGLTSQIRSRTLSFWSEVAELREIIQKKVHAGHGRNALREAVKEQSARPAAAPVPRKCTNHTKTFILAMLFGAVWQGSKRRRKL